MHAQSLHSSRPALMACGWRSTCTQSLLFALVLSATVAPAWAQVGPPEPKVAPQKSAGESLVKMKEGLTRFFKPAEEPGATPSKSKAAVPATDTRVIRKGAGTPGLFDTVTLQPKPGQLKAKAKTDNTAKEDSADEASSATGQQQPAPTVMRASERPKLIEQPVLNKAEVTLPEVSTENPPVKTPTLENPNNPLGLTSARKRLDDAVALIEKRQLVQAKQVLTPLQQWLTESTEAHINLYKALSVAPSARAQAELEKQVALEFAKMRDTAFYHMGHVYMLENNPRDAIKVLTEVVKSQPSAEVGLNAYSLLQKMGFTQQLQLVE